MVASGGHASVSAFVVAEDAQGGSFEIVELAAV
jgi:hypothetical protein